MKAKKINRTPEVSARQSVSADGIGTQKKAPKRGVNKQRFDSHMGFKRVEARGL